MEYTANTLYTGPTGCPRSYGWMIYSDSTHYFAYGSVGGNARGNCGNAIKYAGYTYTSYQESWFSSIVEHNVQLIYDGSRLKTYFDGILYWDFGIILSTNNMFGFFEQESTSLSENAAYWDNFRVRNYTTHEPQWYTISAEQQSVDSAVAFLIAGD